MVWDEQHDQRFLLELKFARRFVPLHHDEAANPVLVVIRGVMEDLFHNTLPDDLIRRRFAELKERYILFDYVLKFPFVRYNPETNQIRMPEEINLALRHVYPDTERFLDQGEPMWQDLKFIFQHPHERIHDPDEVRHPLFRFERMDPNQFVADGLDGGNQTAIILRYCAIYNDIYRRI